MPSKRKSKGNDPAAPVVDFTTDDDGRLDVGVCVSVATEESLPAPGGVSAQIRARNEKHAANWASLSGQRMSPTTAKDKDPPWTKLRGVKRVLAEYRALHAAIATGESGVRDLSLPRESNAFVWRLAMRDFDESTPGGSVLNEDLAELAKQYPHDQACQKRQVTFEVVFPHRYPHDPPFLRVVTPKMVWYTGHVTAGGSVCLEMLTPQQWRPQYSIQSILETVKHAVVTVTPVVVKTAFGGGIAGPLRVDLNRQYCHAPNTEYSEGQARAAFDRAVAHHSRNGW